MENPFKWCHYKPDIILLVVRCYLRYSLSYRDVEEIMSERGLSLDHTTIYRWLQQYSPEIDKRSHPHLQKTNDSWRVDETYVKVRRKRKYPSTEAIHCRAVWISCLSQKRPFRFILPAYNQLGLSGSKRSLLPSRPQFQRHHR